MSVRTSSVLLPGDVFVTFSLRRRLQRVGNLEHVKPIFQLHR